uniref:E3 ubiquitin-protein ligase APD1-4 middle domain-containing protein n=1 Tax=Dendroctonus ponderosae TaxID=77166 RepID=J3JZ89_DENPD|nr:unknown [Dendroctonus ponderosae]
MSNRRTDLEELPLQTFGVYERRSSKNLKGPLRVVRLCILGVVVPTLILGVPLYLRYNVYGAQLYPLAMSDMRMIDNRVSTTWCQKQRVRTNTTFNAFLLADSPKLSNSLRTLSMVRHLVLEDDVKEYWGFYLLKGSSVTVNTCVRWPGASLIVIRGHRHLHECAYIGDDSSEELDELMEAIKEGKYVGNTQDLQKPVSNESITNDPELMKRHRSDVEFHSPHHAINKDNHTLKDNVDISDLNDSKVLKSILEALKLKKNKKCQKDHPHFKRNSTIAKNETGNFNIYSPGEAAALSSQEIVSQLYSRLKSLGEKAPKYLEELSRKFEANNETRPEFSTDGALDLGHLGTQGRQYKKPLVNFNKDIDNRKKREVMGAYVDLNRDDSENNNANEDGFVQAPDGIADHRGMLNETTDHDMSNSEFWSSFSSSEEALLNCEGLILNLPLTPHHNCRSDLSEQEAEETYLANSITYRVPVNGYYFFVFNSENEVQPNYLRVQFHINKAVYNLTDPVAVCVNSSNMCEVDLKFFSSEKLVLELPVLGNDTLWNEEFIIESECEPRTALYAICVIAVPVIIILFAFS